MFTPTAVSRGRVRIQHPDRVVDQRFVRVCSKRETGWQAVYVVVFSGWHGTIETPALAIA